jgi:drug/metabolite transporter (DMT)-like permease
MTKKSPYFALIIGVAAVSTGAVFARLADAPSLVIAAYRVGIASLILAPLACWKAKDELLKLSGQDITLAMISGFFLALHFAAWISSLNYTSIANSVVLVSTNPLWVALLTPFITKERIRPAAIVSIFISVVGGVIIGAGDFAAGYRALFGDFLALAGSICAAVYLLLGRNLRRKLSLPAYIFICYSTAALILWCVVLSFQMQISGFDSDTLAAFLAMAIVPQLIGHTCYNWSLKWFSTNLVAVSLLGEPVGATILGYMIFKEGLTVPKIIGGMLILFAVCFAAINEKK